MSQQSSDDFAKQVADEVERLWRAEHPPAAPKPAPQLPEEPELVHHWRQIIAYRDSLCETIVKWEMAPFELGEIPQQHLRDLRSRLAELDEAIVTKERRKADSNSRGHTVERLGELAAIPAEAERARKAYWVELWLSQKGHEHRPLTAETVKAELRVNDLDELERRVRKQLSDEDHSKPRSTVALRMVQAAEAQEKRATG